MIELRLRFTPDGIVVERWQGEQRLSCGIHADIDSALESLRIQLKQEERNYLFPGLTDDQIEVNKLARAIEAAL